MKLNRILITGLLICGLHAMEGTNTEKEYFNDFSIFKKALAKMINSDVYTEKLLWNNIQTNNLETMYSILDFICELRKDDDQFFEFYLYKNYQNLYPSKKTMLKINYTYECYLEANPLHVNDLDKFLEKNNDTALPKELKKAWFELYVLKQPLSDFAKEKLNF